MSMSLTGSRFSSDSAPRALPSWDSKTRWNNLWRDLAAEVTAGSSGHTNSPHIASEAAQHPHVFHPPRLFTVFMVTTRASWEGSWERLFVFRAWRWRSRPAPDRGADSAGRELSARPAASVR